MRTRGFARRCPLLFWMTTALQKAPLSHTGSDFLDVVSGCRKTQDLRDFGWRIANVGCFEAGIEQEKIIPLYHLLSIIIYDSYLQICVFGEYIIYACLRTFFFMSVYWDHPFQEASVLQPARLYVRRRYILDTCPNL